MNKGYKKIMILVLLLVFFAGMLLTGCSTENTITVETKKGDMAVRETAESPNEPPEAPSFDGLEQYLRFLDAAEYDEEEFEVFIMQNSSYAMNGIHSPEDIREVQQFLKKYPSPNLKTVN